MRRSLWKNSSFEAEHFHKNVTIRSNHLEQARPHSVNHQERNEDSSNSFLPSSESPEQTTNRTAGKKNSLVRWKYLVPRFTLLAIFWVILALGLEPMLRFGFSSGAAAVLGTAVGIDQVETRVLEPSLNFKRIQIADRDDPKKNAIEIEKIAVALDRNAFLRRKFVAKQVIISGVNWNTDSTLTVASKEEKKQPSRWSLPFQSGAKKLSAAAAKSGTKLFEQLLGQAISPYDPRQLETVKLIEIKDEQWQSRFDLYRNSADQYKQQIDQLKKQIEQAKKGNPLDSLNIYARIANEVDALLAQGKQLKREFTQLGRIAREDMLELDSARIRDYNKLREQISSLPVNADQLTQTILGPEARRQFGELAQWIQFAQKVMNVASTDFDPERSYGRTISFNRSDQLPDFLINEFLLSGVASGNSQSVPFTGVIKNITHAPKQLGKPIQYELKLSRRGAAHFKGVIDLTGETPLYTLNGKFESFDFPVQKLTDHKNLSLALATGKMQGVIRLRLHGDQIEATLSWNQADVNFLVDGDVKWEQSELTSLGFSPLSPVDLLKRSLEGIHGIHGEVHLSGLLTAPTIELRSDIGKVIADRLQSEFQKEALLRQDEARALANQQIEQRLQKLTTRIEQEYKTLLSELNLNENLAKNLVEIVAVRPASGVLNRLFR